MPDPDATGERMVPSEAAETTVRLSDLERELAARRRRTDEFVASAERGSLEVANLRRELEERLRLARKLKREVVERDRQFLERLGDLERLEGRAAQLELDRDRSARLRAALAVRLEAAGELIGELEDALEGQEALLSWNRDSAVVQALKVQAVEARGERLEGLGRQLEDASYQHQLGLDHHSRELAHVADQLAALGLEVQRQDAELAGARAVDVEIKEFLQGRPWRGDGPWARAWNRLRGRAPAAEVATRRRVEAAVRDLAPSRRPRVTIALPIDGQVESICGSLASIAGSAADVRYEVLVLGVDPDRPLDRALKASAVVRYVRVDRPGDEVSRAAARARGESVLFLTGDVRLGPDTIRRLCESLAAFDDAGIVAPRLLTENGESQLAFGGALDETGRPFPVGQVHDWEALDYSFARSTTFAPGACFMARRSLLLEVARRDEDVIGSLAGAADLASRVQATGAEVYVQPGASVVCGGAVMEALTAPEALPEPGVPARPGPGRKPRLLIVDHRLPTPDQDSGSVRMSHMLDILRELGFNVTLIPADNLPIQPYCENLQRQGVEVVTRPWVVSPREFIAEQAHRFDGAIVCRCDVARDFMDAVLTALPDKPVIFDTVDLQFLRERRRARLEGSEEGEAKAELVRKEELAVALKANSVLVVSEFELDLLRADIPGADVRLVSNIHHVPGSARGFFGRKDLFFVGGFEHQPNVDAVRWLVEEILPLVRRELRDVQTHIVGSKPTAEVRALASESVTIKGFVPDLTPFLEGCRLSLAPLRYGAGVKGKVNQSLAHGVPCVMTPMAAEGMGLTHGLDAMMGETAQEFAAAVIKTYRNPWLWHRLSRHGVRNTRERFSVKVARREMEALLADLGLIGPDRHSERASGS